MQLTKSLPRRERWDADVLTKNEKAIRRRNYYQVHPVKEKKISDLTAAYILFKERWADHLIDQISGCKTIVLDEAQKPIAEVYFEPSSSIKNEDIEVLFKVIKQEIKGAYFVKVAFNNIFGEYKRNEKDLELAERFQKIGLRECIPVLKTYLITSMSICEL